MRAGFPALILTAAFWLCPSVSNGATLNFTVFSDGPQGVTTLILPEATLTSFGSDFLIGFSGTVVCPLGNGCEHDMSISFANPVENLQFSVQNFDANDAIRVFASNTTAPVHDFDLKGNGIVTDLVAFSGITDLLFDYQSIGGGGILYGNFSFDFAPVSTVPVPPAWLLFVSALATLSTIGLPSLRLKAGDEMVVV